MGVHIDKKFFENAAEILEKARENAKAAIDFSMVYAYFEIGRLIMEEEQSGEKRAAYGKYIITELSKYLTQHVGRGFSVTNLKQMRKFYRVYADDQIGQTLSDQLRHLPAVSTGRKFVLSWSHYLKLMRIDNIEERHFYELEAFQNHWGLKELQRQFDSALYERLSLSKNKEKVMELSEKGQIIEKPEDMLKDPYILEFTGLEEKPEFSESEFESRLIDHLQEFLLELGKEFAFIGRQVRFTFDEQHFRVDLVFYNRLLQCFVLFDLKMGTLTPTYMMDRGSGYYQHSVDEEADFTGWNNQRIVPELSDAAVLEHIQKIQRANQIEPSNKLEGRYNLTIEMETGVGKTYTYCKTMYELNKHYGWSKFIIVVPSIAIREGVYKSLQVTQEHFAEEYGKKIRFFIYKSTQLTEIDHFASDSSINVMIINSQAFNARGKDARRIYMKLDEFRSRRPIDIIAKTNPILIIDEPQSVEGKKTKERLQEFNPLFTLRYSATHKSDSIYNMVYRLDAMEAYNKKLVKKIAVKGITESGSTATESYVYLQGINLSKSAPTATIQFDCKTKSGTPRKVTRIVKEHYNLYDHSGELEEYKNGFVVKHIDGRDDSIEFLNGIKIYAGDVIGKVSEEQIRRLQIRETILSHIERERQLFHKGIKVLSLFFIDEVEHYKKYDAAGQAQNGIFADMFEEEYSDIINGMQIAMGDDEYIKYLEAVPVPSTHAGYFSIDKKGRITNSKLSDKKERTSDDMDAYDLIMKNKELLLDRNPKKSPVRFIFSHSALREGWDNPNVFQICTLKQSSSEVRKRQEVGRGLRLCVNQDGERMDSAVLGKDVHNINVLTVIASESYDSFAKGLQSEMAEAVADRPRAVTVELFQGKVIADDKGNEMTIDMETARAIHTDLLINGYIDRKYALTDKYYEAKANGDIQLAEEVADCKQAVVDILDSIYSPKAMQPENARSGNVEAELDEDKLAMPEFQALWEKISSKSMYIVDFDTDELIRRSVDALNEKLVVAKIYYKVESGIMDDISSKEALLYGNAFVRESAATYNAGTKISANRGVKYDLVGKLVDETGLTRKAVIHILKGIELPVFNQFRDNPEEFILKAARLINEEKATAIIQHITYDILDEHYETDLFTDSTIKGKLGVNAMKAKKHLYDHIVYDSTNERNFAEQLDTDTSVAVYVKLPDGFYISTPVGHYNPDWAIAFYEGTVKHIYFVAETKGSMSSLQLREIEKSKIHCAKEHFKAISGGDVVYDVVDSYQSLLDLVRK